MTLLALGLVLLFAWPAYHLLLVAWSWRGTRAPARHGQRPRGGGRPRGGTPTVFWIVVPCLNEERVIERTVRAALAMRARHARTRVLVVDDACDDGSPAILAAMRNPDLYVLRRDFPAARLGKGSALNAAYRFIRAQTAANGENPKRVAVGVIDGDGRAEPGLLREVQRFLTDPAVGAVQCRVRIHNRDRLLGAVQDLEFACIANASQVLRDAFGTVGLGGNGQFARLSALLPLGEAPWSDCLVEDLELGLRLHLAGVKIRYASRAAVTQQGVVDPRRLLRQRTRWAQGNLQCVRYLPGLVASRRISNTALLEMLHYLAAPWLNALGTAALAIFGGYAVFRLAAGRPTVFLSSPDNLWRGLAVWFAVLLAPGLIWAVSHRLRLRDERLWRCLLAGVAYPLFLLLGVVSTWRAIGRQVAGRSAWIKTERIVDELGVRDGFAGSAPAGGNAA